MNVTVKQQSPASQRLDIAVKLIGLAYTVVMAWQVAKMMSPDLARREQALVARVLQRYRKPGPPTQGQLNDFVAEVTKYVREHD